MKEGTKAKWFIDALMEFILDRDAELAENKEFSGQLKEFIASTKPAKKAKTRKPRAPKALPYDGIIDQNPLPESQRRTYKTNGADTEEHAN